MGQHKGDWCDVCGALQYVTPDGEHHCGLSTKPWLVKNLVYCLECEEKFSLADAIAGGYFMQTGMCRACYQRMYKADVKVSCFGKKYDSTEIQCSDFCPDRTVCKDWNGSPS